MLGRGFFSGVIWGTGAAIIAIWLASQIAEMTNFLSKPSDIAATAPASVDVTTAKLEEAPAVPTESSVPATDPSRQKVALGTGTPEAPPRAETESSAAPVTGDAGSTPPEPTTGQAPSIRESEQERAPSNAATTAPAEPSLETNPVALAKVAQSDTSVTTSVAQAVPEQTTPQSGNSAAAEDPSVTSVDPDKPRAPTGESAPVVDFSTPQVVTAPPPEPEPESAPVVPSEQIAVVVPDPAPVSEPSPKPTVLAVPDTAPKPSTESSTSSGGTEEPALKRQSALKPGDKIGKVRTNRLPTIGGDTQDASTQPEAELIIDTDAPAIERFAVPFENQNGQPLMAIVLIVDPDDPDAVAAGNSLPFPVSYVVDSSRDNAGAIMRAYRSAGYEVVALTPLPDKASPVDVEVAFQSYLTAVPQAVAVIDTRDAAFQSGRAVATQVAEALAASGHGMITYSRGMNSALQIAERANVASAIVFREFDSDGQDSGAIKRFLDQAAFRAGQQTGVILVGHNRPETVKALLEWSLGNRAGTVALAPVSAVLLAQ